MNTSPPPPTPNEPPPRGRSDPPERLDIRQENRRRTSGCLIWGLLAIGVAALIWWWWARGGP